MAQKEKSKNWFIRHKVLSTVLGLVLLVIIVSAIGGSGQSGGSGKSSGSNSAKTYRFADRADKQAKDVELLPNETGDVGGVKLAVTDIQYATTLGDFDKADVGKTYLVAAVQLENTSDRTQPYNQYDFRVQTAGGQVLDSTIVISISDQLNSGDLVAGGKASGRVAFEVPVEEAHQYIIWKPGFSSDRAIVQAK